MHPTLSLFDLPLLAQRPATQSLSPVLTDLTLWIESDDTTYESGSAHTVWPDKGPYTFASGTKTTCLQSSTSVTMTAPLNGKNGVQLNGPSNYVRERGIADGAGANEGDDVDGTILYDPVDGELTYQILAKFPTGAAGFSSWVSQFFQPGEEVHLDNFFDAGSLRIGDVGDESTLKTIDANPVLVSVVRTGNTWRVYLDTDFSTVIATKSYAFTPGTATAMHLHGGGTAFVFYALLVYKRPLTTEELQQNLAYLQDASRWGTWA